MGTGCGRRARCGSGRAGPGPECGCEVRLRAGAVGRQRLRIGLAAFRGRVWAEAGRGWDRGAGRGPGVGQLCIGARSAVGPDRVWARPAVRRDLLWIWVGCGSGGCRPGRVRCGSGSAVGRDGVWIRTGLWAGPARCAGRGPGWWGHASGGRRAEDRDGWESEPPFAAMYRHSSRTGRSSRVSSQSRPPLLGANCHSTGMQGKHRNARQAVVRVQSAAPVVLKHRTSTASAECGVRMMAARGSRRRPADGRALSDHLFAECSRGGRVRMQVGLSSATSVLERHPMRPPRRLR
jgi:hypothetical protein